MINLRKRFTAYVIFTGSENRNWWRFFVRRGWRHVYVVLPAYYPAPSLTAVAYSQIINPWTDHIRSDVLFMSPREVCEEALREGATCVITMPIDQRFTGRYLPRGFLTCVSLVKALLSIGAWYVWTPEQLARWMLQHGGKVMERPNDVSDFQQAEGGHEGAGSGPEGAASTGRCGRRAVSN